MDYKPTGTPVAVQTGSLAVDTTEKTIFKYIAPSRVRITLLAVQGDGNMVANGSIIALFKGASLTGTQAAPGWIGLISSAQGFVFDCEQSDREILH